MTHSHATEAIPVEQTVEQSLWRAVLFETIKEWL